jgi:hypothetical protein
MNFESASQLFHGKVGDDELEEEPLTIFDLPELDIIPADGLAERPVPKSNERLNYLPGDPRNPEKGKRSDRPD